MIPIIVAVGPLVVAADNNIATLQTLGSATTVTLNGSTVTSGVAILDTARRVLISSAANDSGITFRVTGTNLTGNVIREIVAGTNGSSAFTVQDFLTVTEVLTSGATAGNIKVGTNGIASSPWKIINYHMGPVNLSVGVIVSGTVNYTIEYSYDNPNNNQNVLGSPPPIGNYPTPPNPWAHPILKNLAVNADSTINDPIFAWRLTLNSQTNPGSATATSIQAGLGNSSWGGWA